MSMADAVAQTVEFLPRVHRGTGIAAAGLAAPKRKDA